MPKVQIVERTTTKVAPVREVKLQNGDLVISKSNSGEVIDTFQVISYRNSNSTNSPEVHQTARYCSLVNLSIGYSAFSEPCSRSTTNHRVIDHLVSGYSRKTSNTIPYDIDVISKDNYSIRIEVSK